MARGEPAQVMGIWLRREGDYAVVLAENIYGEEIELIREHIEGCFSHNISEHGINRRFYDAYWKRINERIADAKAQKISKKKVV